jgi:hypothetical protein
MTSLDRVFRPSLTEKYGSHLQEGFIIGWIPGIVTSLDDPEKLGRVQCTCPLIDEGLNMPNIDGQWCWVAESFTVSDGEGGSISPLQIGSQVRLEAMMGDPRYLTVIGALHSRIDRPPSVLDRSKGIHGSVTSHQIMTIHNDPEESFIHSFPHGVTKAISGTGDIINQTRDGAATILRQDGTIMVQNPKSSMFLDPNGAISQCIATGSKSLLKADGQIEIINSQGAKLDLSHAKTRLIGPPGILGSLLGKAKGLSGILGKVSSIAKKIKNLDISAIAEGAALYAELSTGASGFSAAFSALGEMKSVPVSHFATAIQPQVSICLDKNIPSIARQVTRIINSNETFESMASSIKSIGESHNTDFNDLGDLSQFIESMSQTPDQLTNAIVSEFTDGFADIAQVSAMGLLTNLDLLQNEFITIYDWSIEEGHTGISGKDTFNELYQELTVALSPWQPENQAIFNSIIDNEPYSTLISYRVEDTPTSFPQNTVNKISQILISMGNILFDEIKKFLKDLLPWIPTKKEIANSLNSDKPISTLMAYYQKSEIYNATAEIASLDPLLKSATYVAQTIENINQENYYQVFQNINEIDKISTSELLENLELLRDEFTTIRDWSMDEGYTGISGKDTFNELYQELTVALFPWQPENQAIFNSIISDEPYNTLISYSTSSVLAGFSQNAIDLIVKEILASMADILFNDIKKYLMNAFAWTPTRNELINSLKSDQPIPTLMTYYENYQKSNTPEEYNLSSFSEMSLPEESSNPDNYSYSFASYQLGDTSIKEWGSIDMSDATVADLLGDINPHTIDLNISVSKLLDAIKLQEVDLSIFGIQQKINLKNLLSGINLGTINLSGSMKGVANNIVDLSDLRIGDIIESVDDRSLDKLVDFSLADPLGKFFSINEDKNEIEIYNLLTNEESEIGTIKLQSIFPEADKDINLQQVINEFNLGALKTSQLSFPDVAEVDISKIDKSSISIPVSIGNTSQKQVENLWIGMQERITSKISSISDKGSGIINKLDRIIPFGGSGSRVELDNFQGRMTSEFGATSIFVNNFSAGVASTFGKFALGGGGGGGGLLSMAGSLCLAAAEKFGRNASGVFVSPKVGTVISQTNQYDYEKTNSEDWYFPNAKIQVNDNVVTIASAGETSSIVVNDNGIRISSHGLNMDICDGNLTIRSGSNILLFNNLGFSLNGVDISTIFSDHNQILERLAAIESQISPTS